MRSPCALFKGQTVARCLVSDGMALGLFAHRLIMATRFDRHQESGDLDTAVAMVFSQLARSLICSLRRSGG